MTPIKSIDYFVASCMKLMLVLLKAHLRHRSIHYPLDITLSFLRKFRIKAIEEEYPLDMHQLCRLATSAALYDARLVAELKS